MARRKAFLAVLGTAGVSLALAARSEAQSQPKPAASASPGATAVAAGMRRFDPHLSDAQIAKIAREIDDDAKAGAILNPKKHRLANGDEPFTVFTVPAE